MPTLLSDPPRVVLLLLIAAVVISGALAFRRQDKKSTIAFAISATLLLTVWLLSMFNESPREEAIRRVEAMAKAATELNPDAFVANIADRLEYDGGSGKPRVFTKTELRNVPFWGLLKNLKVEANVKEFDREQVKELGPDAIEIGFLGQGWAEGTPYPMWFRATFQKQSNGNWLMTKLASFDHAKRAEPKSIPGF